MPVHARPGQVEGSAGGRKAKLRRDLDRCVHQDPLSSSSLTGQSGIPQELTARPAGPPLPHEIDLVDRLRARMQANPRLKVMLCVPRMPDFVAAKANWVRAALAHRKQAIETLTAQDRKRVAAFHPIGFPGRPTAIRSTVVIVDDVWALVGTSHFRRRGMTFDGGVDVVSIDRAFGPRGTSVGIARFRQELLANRLGVTIPAGPGASSALWTRLAEPESTFDVLAGCCPAAVWAAARPSGPGRPTRRSSCRAMRSPIPTASMPMAAACSPCLAHSCSRRERWRSIAPSAQ
jgi:hypothetical protein